MTRSVTFIVAWNDDRLARVVRRWDVRETLPVGMQDVDTLRITCGA